MRGVVTDPSRPILCRARSSFVGRVRSSFVGRAGPEGAFESGQESEARRKLFNRIAPVYDDQSTVKWSGARLGNKVLDVCCGSGDIALQLAKLVGPRGKVVGLDFAGDMLYDAEKRQKQQEVLGLPQFHTPMQWVQGDATALPFKDDEFDAATMGYGLRNVNNRAKAMAELYRVLKPGASVAILDFNNSTDPTVDNVQGWFLENLVVPTARQYGLADEYEYLRPSIKQFPTGWEQEALAMQTGFVTAKHHEIAFGLMGILVASK